MIDISQQNVPPSPIIPAAEPGCRPPILLLDALTSDASSTEIRRRVAAGGSIASLVPRAVAVHIHRHGLYEARQLHGQD
jgi:nicotinic acid mononucleotide adenylyltransferase